MLVMPWPLRGNDVKPLSKNSRAYHSRYIVVDLLS